MRAEKTRPFLLGPGPAEAKGTVLLLHGFTGSPWEVRPLGEALAARGYHVVAPLLPGHGREPEAMLWVTAREWLHAAEAALDELTASRVFVAGLSMGALLGVLLAARRGEKVGGLVLMAPVVGLKGLDARLLRLLRRFSLGGIKERWLTKSSTDIEDVVERERSPILPRYPLARVLDLMTLQDLVRSSVRAVRCEALIVAAENDHVIDPAGVSWLHERLPGSRLVWLQRGFHILPRDVDRARLFVEAGEFLDVLSARG